MSALVVALVALPLGSGCRRGASESECPTSPAASATAAAPAPAASSTVSEPVVADAPATATATTAAAEAAAPAGKQAALDPAAGATIGLVFEAFLSPDQEPDEESATPKRTPAVFRSTAPSKTRAERVAAGHRGHGRIRFSKDLSRAFVDVKIEGVAADTINMFHIHCGPPGVLGPILIDLALTTDLQKDLADGVLSVEIRNEHLVQTSHHGHGAIAAFTAGCVIPSPSLGGVVTKVSTVAGMAQIAAEGELYFNLHTTAQTYFGDMRGQILSAAP